MQMDSRQFLEHDLHVLRDDEWGRGRDRGFARQNKAPIPFLFLFFFSTTTLSPFAFDTQLQEVLVEIDASKNWTHRIERHIIGHFRCFSQTDVTRFEAVLF